MAGVKVWRDAFGWWVADNGGPNVVVAATHSTACWAADKMVNDPTSPYLASSGWRPREMYPRATEVTS